MTDVKPYEPVSYRWAFERDVFKPRDIATRWGACETAVMASRSSIQNVFRRDRMHVTIANGQTIIVRAKR